jgi:hypothetical protein
MNDRNSLRYHGIHLAEHRGLAEPLGSHGSTTEGLPPGLPRCMGQILADDA